MATLFFGGDSRLQFSITNAELEEKALRLGARKVAANEVETKYRLGPDLTGNQHMVIIATHDSEARHIMNRACKVGKDNKRKG